MHIPSNDYGLVEDVHSALGHALTAAVRQAVEEGRYEVVPERIANKLLRMNQELGTTEK